MDLTGRAVVKCPKCKALIDADTDEGKIYVKSTTECQTD